MLGKLIKHEFKATSKVFPLIFVAIGGMALINLVLQPWSFERIIQWGSVASIISGVLIFGYELVVLAGIIAAIAIIIMRFYNNLLGDQGYLMFTLPVANNNHIASKFIVGVTWSILTCLVVLLSSLVMTAHAGSFDLMSMLFRQAAANNLTMEVVFLILVAALFLTTALAAGIMQFYTACALGPVMLKNRLGGTILAYVVIYVIGQIVGFVLILSAAASPILKTLENMSNPTSGLGGVTSTTINALSIYLLAMCVMYILLTAVGWFVTKYLLDKKLNLA